MSSSRKNPMSFPQTFKIDKSPAFNMKALDLKSQNDFSEDYQSPTTIKAEKLSTKSGLRQKNLAPLRIREQDSASK